MSNLLTNTEKLDLISKTRQALDITKKTTNQIQITQEHIDWWESLPQILKRVLIVHLNYNEITKLPPDLYQEVLSSLIDFEKHLFCWDRDFERLNEYCEHLSTPFYLDELQSYNDLSRLFNLEEIRCSFDDYSIEIPYLGNFSKLKKLVLNNFKITDINNIGIEKLYNLKVLSIKYEELYVLKNFPDISQLKNLIVLSIPNLEMDYVMENDNIFNNITKLDNLKYLDIRAINLGDDDIIQLSKLEKLEYLFINQLPDNITALANLKNLKFLGFYDRYSRLNQSEEEWFDLNLPNCELHNLGDSW